jgi:hypothetical protein
LAHSIDEDVDVVLMAREIGSEVAAVGDTPKAAETEARNAVNKPPAAGDAFPTASPHY